MAERASANQRLGKVDAKRLVKQVSRVIAAKGKNVERFETGGKAPAAAVAALLGPTGNLRAPTLRVGATLLVGFDEQAYADTLGCS